MPVRFKQHTDAALRQFARKRKRKLFLLERLPARKRDAAALEIGFIPLQPRDKRICLDRLPMLEERFGVMAERAAKIAPSKEDDAAQPLSVHARTAVNRIDIPDMRGGIFRPALIYVTHSTFFLKENRRFAYILPWYVRLMTSN